MSTEKLRVYAIVQAIEETIKEAGPEGVPLGPVYAACMQIMSYNTFECMIKAMVDLKRIRVSNHCAKWIGE